MPLLQEIDMVDFLLLSTVRSLHLIVNCSDSSGDLTTAAEVCSASWGGGLALHLPPPVAAPSTFHHTTSFVAVELLTGAHVSSDQGRHLLEMLSHLDQV